jgi:hypothetical protein
MLTIAGEIIFGIAVAAAYLMGIGFTLSGISEGDPGVVRVGNFVLISMVTGCVAVVLLRSLHI